MTVMPEPISLTARQGYLRNIICILLSLLYSSLMDVGPVHPPPSVCRNGKQTISNFNFDYLELVEGLFSPRDYHGIAS